jgi:hypothetical protein
MVSDGDPPIVATRSLTQTTECRMKRLVGIIFALAVAGGSAAASQADVSRGHGGKHDGLELTYKKWTAPFPNMVGVVGGDIVGTFGGAVYTATPDATGRVQISAIYIVIAPDASQSFTAHVAGGWDASTTGKAVLDGRVVDGYLKGANVDVKFDTVSCTDSADGTCYQGTISVHRRSEH